MEKTTSAQTSTDEVESLEKQIQELQRKLVIARSQNNVVSGDGNSVNEKSSETVTATLTPLNPSESCAKETESEESCSLEKWAGIAFGGVDCLNDREHILKSVRSELNFKPSPSPGENWLTESDIDKEISLKGTLQYLNLKKCSAKGKRKADKRSCTLEIIPEVTVASTSTQISFGEPVVGIPDVEIAQTLVILDESRLGTDIYNNVVTALKNCDISDGHLVIVRGLVKKQDGTIVMCINNKGSHVALISVKQSEYPQVYDMYGVPVNLPMLQSGDNIFRLLGTFRHAWFHAESNFEKLSNDKMLRHHIAAYRSSGFGGVIYLGLKRISNGQDYEVQNDAIKLSIGELSKFNMKIQEFCSAQYPSCTAIEWNQKSLPSDIAQRRDECLYTNFSTKTISSKISRYVFRLVILPSREPLHLCKESDLGLRKRLGSNSSKYTVEEFISDMNEKSIPIRKELERMSMITDTSNSYPSPIVVLESSPPLPLWEQLPTEDDKLEYKECSTQDPIKCAVEELRDYGTSWLNNSMKGTLRIGVSDKPPLAVGVWINESTTSRLKEALIKRFQGCVQRKEFCFPSILRYISVKKAPIVADCSKLLSKSSKVLILWLVMSNDEDDGDRVRRCFYKLWDEKQCQALTDMFATTSIVPVPINAGLLPKCEARCFPVAIAARDRTKNNQVAKKLLVELKKGNSNISKYMAKYELIDFPAAEQNLIDPDYCILDINVNPPEERIFCLCKVPKFRKLVQSPDVEHIKGKPQKMDFEDILLRCNECSNHHDEQRFNDFFQPYDRPILITDCLNNDSCIKGFARVPWTLIVDFDFGKNTRPEFVEVEKSYYNNIMHLTFTDDAPVDLESMSDVSPVYWVNALGSVDEPITDHELWLMKVEPQLRKYIERACAIIKGKVKILAVWSSSVDEDRKKMVDYTARYLCLHAQQARQNKNNIEIAVVSPSITILGIFTEAVHSKDAKDLHLKLDHLSTILCKLHLPGNSTHGDLLKYCKVPGQPTQFPEKTWKSMKANELNYLYPNIQDDLNALRNYDNGLGFFEGREKLVRWEHFAANVVVNRDKTKQLLENVKKALENKYRKKKEIWLKHYPGTGGSTVARHVLWQLKDSYCCITPFQIYNDLKDDVEQLINASERCVLVLWDTNLGIDFDILRSILKDLDVLFLCVERSFKLDSADVLIQENLIISQLKDFISQISSNIHFNKSKVALDLLLLSAERDKTGVPLFLVMVTGLESQFIPLPEYVKDRLTDLNDEQKQILLQVAFAQLFTGKPLELRAVDAKSKEWRQSLPNPVHDLIRFGGIGDQNSQNGYVHMRHHCIDELVISIITGFIKDSEEWGEWTAKFVVPFLKHLKSEYRISANSEGLFNEFERVLRILFHDKSNTTSLPYFISQIKNKSVAIMCMKEVKITLPPDVKRIIAHFLGDLARVHLIMNKENDLKTAIEIIHAALKLLPKDSTLRHQNGQLFYNSMTLTKETWLDEKIDCAKKLVSLAQKASECFEASCDCELGNKLNKWVPWKSDVQCRVDCLKYICELTDCKSFHQLSSSEILPKHEYITRIEEDTFKLLETLLDRDPVFYKVWSEKLSEVLGSDEDTKKLVEQSFSEIEKNRDQRGSSKHRSKEANTLKRISDIFRVQLYGSARRVPSSYSTKLTNEIQSLIQLRESEGYEEHFFELELLWDWSRYSEKPISTTRIVNIIDRYLKNMTRPELIAKCQLFQGVTLLLKRFCDGDSNVQPEDIKSRISESCRYFKKGTSNWNRTEFIIEGYGNGLLSYKDWSAPFRHIHLLINDKDAINCDYEERKHIKFREFSGHILPLDDEVLCNGLRFSYKKRKVPVWWRESRSEIKFYIAVSSRDGLQAFPAYPLKDDKLPVLNHTWILGGKINTGRIMDITRGGRVHFGPPNKVQPYRCYASCNSREFKWEPEKGDLCEFTVEKIDKKLFEAQNITHVSSEN